MKKEIEVSGLRFWYCDSEDQVQIGGIVNLRIEAKSYSSTKAFTRGKDRDEEIRKIREEIYKVRLTNHVPLEEN